MSDLRVSDSQNGRYGDRRRSCPSLLNVWRSVVPGLTNSATDKVAEIRAPRTVPSAPDVK
jgi:hypothetical protein